jgi:methyltransferase (TIGR00027 family)
MNKIYLWLMRNPKILDFFISMGEKQIPGAIGWFFCRDRYVDDRITESFQSTDIETVVNLGAGMDCRAYYLPCLAKVPYFHVDHPSVIHKKNKKMKKIFGSLPDNIVYVPIDFQKQTLGVVLKNAGYNLLSKTLFIWEAVTQYISKEANDSTFKYIGQAALGSKLVFSYVIKSFFEGKYNNDGIKKLAKRFLKKNNPVFITGFNPVDMKDYLSKNSLMLIEDIDSIEMQERYSKLVDLDFLKTIKEFNIEQFILAEVK